MSLYRQPPFSFIFGRFSGERKRLGGSRVRRHHSSTDRSLFIAREDNGTCLIFDATPDTAYVNHFSRANIFQYDSKQVDPATSSPLGCCATSLKLPSLAFSLSLRSLRTYEKSTWSKSRISPEIEATIADKMSWDTSPKTGLFYVLLTSKGGNIAFLPHPLRAMLCPCSSYL